METKLYPDSPVQNSLQVGAEFQDFAAYHIHSQLGLSIQIYGSKKYQYAEGESTQGVEFKLDKGFIKYDHLSIEIAEKTNAAHNLWTPSGIYRKDNTWLYVQGNYDYFYIFFKHTLVHLHDQGRLEKAGDLPTIRRAYLALPLADKIGKKVVPIG